MCVYPPFSRRLRWFTIHGDKPASSYAVCTISWLWVTADLPGNGPLLLISSNSYLISIEYRPSKLPVGSSAKSISGQLISHRLVTQLLAAVHHLTAAADKICISMRVPPKAAHSPSMDWNRSLMLCGSCWIAAAQMPFSQTFAVLARPEVLNIMPSLLRYFWNVAPGHPGSYR